MNFDSIDDMDISKYSEDIVDDFVSMNDVDVDKSLVGMPEHLRSMFIELTFIGTAYLNPKLIKRFEESMRPKYDFTSPANRFFYETLIKIGQINEWKISEYTVNAFMADDINRMKTYQKFGGYNWIKFVMKMAEQNESIKSIDKYYNMVKNYSLLREYWRKGLKEITEKIPRYTKFNSYTPRDILMIISKCINNVYTALANAEEVKDLTSGCEDFVCEKLQFPEQGLPFAFPLMTQVFNGIRLGQFMAFGMLSNAGKSRFLMREITNLAFVQNESVLIISNEMTEEEMRACLIVTAINNPDIQALHGIEISLIQNRLQNGIYQVDDKYKGDKGTSENNVVHIVDEDGKQIETPEEYIKRVEEMSTEFKQVRKIAHWIDTKMAKKIQIIETGSDYSDEDLKQIIDNTCLTNDIKYVFYDTFKSDKSAMGDWSAMKKTATILSEIAKKRNIFIGANIQLTDDALNCEPLQLSSNNIANSKQIKHVLDSLCLFREINPVDYNKYQYWDSIAEPSQAVCKKDLSLEKRYYVCRIDKNRAGGKPDLLFSLNLDTNIWTEEGRVALIEGYDKVTTDNNGKKKYSKVSVWNPPQ